MANPARTTIRYSNITDGRPTCGFSKSGKSSPSRILRYRIPSRSVYHYQPDETKDDAVIEAIQAVVERYPAYGFSKVLTVLRRRSHPWNHKRV